MGRRITRKQLKQDEFVSAGEAIIRWFMDNWRPIVAGLSAVCLLIVMWWTAGRWSASRAEQASYELHQAVTAADEAAQGGDVATARQTLETFIDDHGRDDQADMARVYLARLKMDQDDFEAARGLLVEVADRNPENAVGRLAMLDLIHLRLANGEGAEVAGELEAMAAGQDTRLPPDVALWQLGELYVGQNQPELAKTYYQTLVDEFPESPYRGRAGQRLTELG
jgi:predicted negative regulator of RcsB-dependent stress response